MITPIIPEKIFEVNKNLSPVFYNNKIIIDNYYKNIEDIQKLLNNLEAPRWKWSKNGKNFVDYYDCRPVIANHYYSEEYVENMKNIINMIGYFYNEKSLLRLQSPNYEFNFYKNINITDSNLQMIPHRDSPYAGIIYIDNVSSGGTAFYDNPSNIQFEDEDITLFTDTSKLDKNIVKAKPNRLVIFKGTDLHGGYILDHSKYLNEWRQNQVFFLHKHEDAPNSNKKPY